MDGRAGVNEISECADARVKIVDDDHMVLTIFTQKCNTNYFDSKTCFMTSINVVHAVLER